MQRNCPYCTAYLPINILSNRLVAPTKGSLHDGYDVVECDKCGGVYANNIPDPRSIKDYYATQSKRTLGYKADDWKEPDGRVEIHKETKEWIMNHVKLGSSILDIGCFTGDLLSMFRGEAKLFGYDPSNRGQEVAMRRYGLDIKVASQFRDTSFFLDGNLFSLVILSHVVEHIVDVDSFFADIRLAVENSGQIYIEVPDITNWFLSEDRGGLIDRREPLIQLSAEHVNFFSPSSLSWMMSRLGYDCVELESRKQKTSVISSIWKVREKVRDTKYLLKYYAESLVVYERHNSVLQGITGSVYVWGAGGHSQRMLQYSELAKMSIEAFVESNDDYYGGTLAERPIISPLEIDKPYPIIISSLMYQEEILKQIKKMKLRNQVVTFY